MHLFLYEYVTGGGLFDGDLAGPEPPPSLVREGRAMAHALAADFAALAETRVTLLRDPRLAPPAAGARSIDVASAAEHRRQFDALVREADQIVLIAPEFSVGQACSLSKTPSQGDPSATGLLFEAARRVEQLGGRLLGPDPAWIATAADKQATCELLAAGGVPVVEGISLAAGERLPEAFSYPAVLKRRDGAGSCDARRIADASEAARHPPLPFAARLEPLRPGRPASVAVLCGAGGVMQTLAPCFQRIADDGAFTYLGGSLIADDDLAERASRLARAAVAALGPARGYVGVDLLLGEAAADDCVVEINPRLTTSYIGLRAAYRENLAAAMLAAAEGRPLDLHLDRREVSFDADGTVFLETGIGA